MPHRRRLRRRIAVRPKHADLRRMYCLELAGLPRRSHGFALHGEWRVRLRDRRRVRPADLGTRLRSDDLTLHPRLPRHRRQQLSRRAGLRVHHKRDRILRALGTRVPGRWGRFGRIERRSRDGRADGGPQRRRVGSGNWWRRHDGRSGRHEQRRRGRRVWKDGHGRRRWFRRRGLNGHRRRQRRSSELAGGLPGRRCLQLRRGRAQLASRELAAPGRNQPRRDAPTAQTLAR